MLPGLVLGSGLCVGEDNWHAFPELRKYGPQLLAEFLKFAYARGEPANVVLCLRNAISEMANFANSEIY